MSDLKVTRARSSDWLENWIAIEGEDNHTDVLKLQFMHVPFVDSVFIEKMTKALMEEIREQFISWKEGESYDRNPTYFDRKKAERTAIKIIEDMKGGFDGLCTPLVSAGGH